MMIKKIMEELEKKYPKKNAEEWDNVGLLIGDSQDEITGIVITLDVDEASIELAKKNSANLIIAHHPLIFKGLKNIDYSTPLGRKIKEIIKSGINLLTLHTNIDSSVDGLNDYILKKIGIKDSKILVPSKERDSGIGRYYKLDNLMNIDEYCKKIKKNLDIEMMTLYSKNKDKLCKKVAFVNGSGAEFWKNANFYKCDLLITSDTKYHIVQEALEEKFSILDLGHYESEKEFMNLVYEIIDEIGVEVAVYKNSCKLVKPMLY